MDSIKNSDNAITTTKGLENIATFNHYTNDDLENQAIFDNASSGYVLNLFVKVQDENGNWDDL